MKQQLQAVLRAVAVAGVTLGLAGPAASQSAADSAPSGRPAPPAGAAADPGTSVVATVNGTDIYLSDVQEALESLPQQYHDLPLQVVYQALVNQLIDRRLAAMAAREQKLDEKPEVKHRLEQAEEAVLHQAWLTDKVAPALSEEKLRERYDRDIAGKPGPVEVHARHILVATQPEAQDIADQLGRGADFVELAKQKSKDSSTAQGGDLGYFRREDMVPQFADAAFAMQEGEVSAPVQTPFGWHIIKVEDRRTLPAPSFDESVEQLKNQVAGEVIADASQALRGDAAIQLYNLDGMPQIGPQPAAPAEPGARPAQ